MKKKIALVCIAKNEDYYIQEWIDYHLKLGFDDIHVFQNDWRFLNKKENKNVHFHEYDGLTILQNKPVWVENVQARCYTEFAKNYGDQYEWAAFFDVDEFLVLHKNENVQDFIKDYDDFNCLVINWAMFGDNNIKQFDPNYTNVIERFTKRKNGQHDQFKSICKLNKDMIHNTHWNESNWIDPDFNVGNSPFNYNANFNKAQLNHYYTKTYPEWENKMNKTRCDGKTINSEPFYNNNFNEIDDFSALNFLNKR